MKKTLIIVAVGLLITAGTIAYSTAGKCSGTKSCSACKNCKYCKNCSKNGGTCGVCK